MESALSTALTICPCQIRAGIERKYDYTVRIANKSCVVQRGVCACKLLAWVVNFSSISGLPVKNKDIKTLKRVLITKINNFKNVNSTFHL